MRHRLLFYATKDIHLLIMGKEIERKFLINTDHWNKTAKGEGTLYRQGYLLSDPAKTIRVRLAGNQGYLTIKGMTIGASRTEFEYPIPGQDAIELLESFCANSLSKIRYKIPFAGKLWEIDEFLGDNEGLLLAEIELSAEDESFECPIWVDKEVTDDKRYYNSWLAANPFKKW
jgi:CYTH domain-containing protein